MDSLKNHSSTKLDQLALWILEICHFHVYAILVTAPGGQPWIVYLHVFEIVQF